MVMDFNPYAMRLAGSTAQVVQDEFQLTEEDAREMYWNKDDLSDEEFVENMRRTRRFLAEYVPLRYADEPMRVLYEVLDGPLPEDKFLDLLEEALADFFNEMAPEGMVFSTPDGAPDVGVIYMPDPWIEESYV